jgi:hypothetical protein
MAKGWPVWVFKIAEEVNKALQRRWKRGFQNLFLKKWHVNFYAKTTQVDILLVWVLIQGILLVLWWEDAFEETWNSLKKLYETDLYF